MIGYLLKKGFEAFGKKYDYDVDYLIEMAEIYPQKAWRFALTNPLSAHFSAVPKELYFAVKVTACKLADCGACTELTLKLAIEAGLDRQQLGHLILADEENMDELILLGYKYAVAVAQNSLDLPEIISHIGIEYGKKGLWDLTNAFNFGEFYPKIKRGLGLAVSCRAPKDIVQDVING